MTDITGGELLACALANEGVRFIFGLPCPEIDPLLVAMEMWAGRPGPVHLDIPLSVMYTTGDPARAPIFAPTAGRPAAPDIGTVEAVWRAAGWERRLHVTVTAANAGRRRFIAADAVVPAGLISRPRSLRQFTMPTATAVLRPLRRASCSSW